MSKNILSNPDNKSFVALQEFNLADALSEEMVGMDVSFDRIKIPSGGSTVFDVPGDAPGEIDAVKEFAGVILYHHPLFSYYRERFTGGNEAPDCGSFDGVTGVGDPGGNCARCPLNQFGSGENGGKACKNKRRIYILREGELIPLLLTLPTGSLKEFSVYIKRLLARGRKSGAVVTRFSLKKVANAGGIAYAQAQFALARPLSSEELPYIEAMAEQVKQFAVRIGYEEEAKCPPEATAATDATIIDPDTGEIIGDDLVDRPLN
jgi:hypothetical protein